MNHAEALEVLSWTWRTGASEVREAIEALRDYPHPFDVFARVRTLSTKHMSCAVCDVCAAALPSLEPAARKLDAIRVFYRSSDSLTLWGIPYTMRAGQTPRDTLSMYRGDWVYLGEPGWFGAMNAERMAEVKTFLAPYESAQMLPQRPHEWCVRHSERELIEARALVTRVNVRMPYLAKDPCTARHEKPDNLTARDVLENDPLAEALRRAEFARSTDAELEARNVFPNARIHFVGA